jgi:hypothetical protein
MASPKLDDIVKLLESGESFSLTDSQYKKKTGLNIPKSPSYLLKKSAISKAAQQYGYSIKLKERELTFEKEMTTIV